MNSKNSSLICNEKDFPDFQNNLKNFLLTYLDNFHKVKYFQIHVKI